MLSPPVPSRIGKYEVSRRIGEGGTGKVSLVIDPDLGRKSAIKVLQKELVEDEATGASCTAEAEKE